LGKLVIALLAALSLGGCATIVRGTTQTIAVNTPGVPGATCTLSSSSVGSMTLTTPANVSVAKGQDSIAVRCEKECYQAGTAIIPSNIEGMTAGNLLFGGVIGIGVDAATGAMNKYPPQTDVVMVAMQGCKPSKTS
jgi:hypothetical protein